MPRKTATSKFEKLQEYLVDLSARMGDEDDLGAILSDADRADIANLGNDAENWQTENPGASAREVNEHLQVSRVSAKLWMLSWSSTRRGVKIRDRDRGGSFSALSLPLADMYT